VCACFAVQSIRHLADSIIILSNFLGLYRVSGMEPGNCVRYVRSACLFNGTGDKSNHIAGINLPQMFYCATFIAAFGTPMVFRLDYFRLFLTSSFWNIRRCVTFWMTTGLILIIVYVNTYAHLLAKSYNPAPNTRSYWRTIDISSSISGEGLLNFILLPDTQQHRSTLRAGGLY